MTATLDIVGLSKEFGGVRAIGGVTLRLERGARHALIGPNGAGKTTFINLLTGHLPPTTGRILFEGSDIGTWAPAVRVAGGIVRTFQINQLFLDMTPLQTVTLAATRAAGLAAKAWQCFGVDKAVQRESIVVLERFDLVEIMNERTRDLPYGKQRLLEIALAIACKPRLLLLDEPAAGVPESDRADIVNALRKLPDDVSILLVEHDMDLVFSFATHIWVLAFGQLIAAGSVEQISSDPKVRRIYLGQDDDDD
ncbi:MAG: ABC transporter ATP-binding protein [Pseudolabrys sp.]